MLCKKTISSGKLQFLKYWSVKGKRRGQNTGKHTIGKFHCVACEILKKPAEGYMLHTWWQSEATNIADAGINFINLKRHRQWVSNAVVEGYIVNSTPLREERLTSLMPAKKRCIEESEEEKSIIDLSNPPQEKKNLYLHLNWCYSSSISLVQMTSFTMINNYPMKSLTFMIELPNLRTWVLSNNSPIVRYGTSTGTCER